MLKVYCSPHSIKVNVPGAKSGLMRSPVKTEKDIESGWTAPSKRCRRYPRTPHSRHFLRMKLMRRTLLPLRDSLMDVSYEPMAANAGAGITCAFHSPPPPSSDQSASDSAPSSSLHLPSDFFTPQRWMDGDGGEGDSIVRRARGKLGTIIICSFPGASPRSVFCRPPRGRTGAV